MAGLVVLAFFYRISGDLVVILRVLHSARDLDSFFGLEDLGRHCPLETFPVHLNRPAGSYGLPLILGAGEVRLLSGYASPTCRAALEAQGLRSPKADTGETGELLAGDCLGRRPHEFRLLTVHPPELVAWWRSQGMAVQETPRLSAACTGLPDAEPPCIVSPDGATAYHLRQTRRPTSSASPWSPRPRPACAGSFGIRTACWWLPPRPTRERQEAASSAPSAASTDWWVTDDLGRSDGVTYKVE